MSLPSRLTLDPADAALNTEVKDAAALARRVLARSMWKCGDGHEHPRPETFTKRRLITEMLKCPEASRWRSTTIGSLGIWELIDSGELVIDKRLQLSKGSR